MTELPIERETGHTADESIPAWLAWVLWGALGLAVLGGLYLYAVRGVALFIDMATMLCF
jgi:hypothetical protein